MIPLYLEPASEFVKKKFALYVIVDMIENLGYENLEEQFDYIMEQLMTYSQEETTVLRQSACFAIGVVAKICPKAFRNYMPE